MPTRPLRTRLRSLRTRSLRLGDAARLLADVYGDRPAVDQEGVGGFTHTSLSDLVDRLAGGFHAAGLAPGQVAAVTTRNGVPQFAAALAVARAGGVPAPANPLLRSHEIEVLLEETGAAGIVVDETTIDRVPEGVTAWVLDELPDGPVPDLPAPGADDVAAIFATSGTTGRPKGAELTHEGLVGFPLSALAVGGIIDWSVLTALPVSHIMGFSSLLSILAAGFHAHVVERFHPVRFLEEAAALHPEVVIAVPTMYRMLLEADGGPDPHEALSSVRVFASGSDVLPPETARRLRELGAKGSIVAEGYGMVELSGAASARVHLPFVGPVPRGDLGIPLPPWRVRIVDERGRPVLPFRVGELEVKGPGVLAGYRNRPDETGEAVRDGWLRTGDLASWGPFGLRFAGRRKDMVKVGGYSVYPREVEEELRACPGVSDAAVVALPDPVKGEVLAAAVEPVAGRTVSPDDVIDFARRELADYRRPVRVVVVDELPRNNNGKVVKERVREMFG